MPAAELTEFDEPRQKFYITETITWEVEGTSEEQALATFLADVDSGYPVCTEQRLVTPVAPQILRQ